MRITRIILLLALVAVGYFLAGNFLDLPGLPTGTPSFGGGTYETPLGEVTLKRGGTVLVDGRESGSFEYSDGAVTITIGGRSDTYRIGDAGNLLLENSGIIKEFKKLK